MRNISSKTDNVGDVLPASDFNINHRIELQSIVTDSGFSLDPEGGPDTDTDMFGKSLTVYANASQYYADTGAADAYEIDRVGNLQPLEQLLDGTIVYFKAANTNTGASTLDVDGIGAKDLVDNGGSALVGGEIIAGQYVQARYNSSTDDFEIIFSNSLINWTNQGSDLVPVISGTGSIGSSSKLIEGIYFDDSAVAYFGADQDMEIYHDGSDGAIDCGTGELTLQTLSASAINFIITGVGGWSVDTSAHLIPSTLLNIGSTTDYVQNIYQGDNCTHYLGDSQDMSLVFDGTDAYLTTNSGGVLYIDNSYNFVSSSLPYIIFRTDDADAWQINGNGDLTPSVTDLKDLGSPSLRVANIYQNGGNHYLNSTQSVYVHSGGWYKNVGSSTEIRNVQAYPIEFYTTDAHRWDINASGYFVPITNNFMDIGDGSHCVRTIYYYTLSACSDERLKENISEVPGLDFLLKINPISFNFIGNDDGKNKKRYGVSAQQIAVIANDFAGVTYDFESDRYGMDYTQLIAPIIQSIQELSEKIDNLQKIEPDNK